ncbi:MAG: GNAT family N-acetyltransferase [Verrucomicrobiaceae bacterium]|nr:MAG: GNAT family N-acetyltransferase [Verrucomicrobiaceae bacterium]
MDHLWSRGWRHFGCGFFRYNVTLSETGGLLHIQPLRIVLDEFTPSRSQRRVMRKNMDLTVETGPALADSVREAMFLRHRERFTHNIPDSLRVFLPEPNPATTPCECREIRLLDKGRLLAVSYLDCGAEAVSSLYAMFEPDAAPRSPGVLTLLEEIAFARRTGRRFLYPGYATLEPSHYDYKKAFSGLQTYDWQTGGWIPCPRSPD